MKLTPLNAVGIAIYNGVSSVKNETVNSCIALKNFIYDCSIDQHKRAASKIGAKQFVKNPIANKTIQVIFKIAASFGILVGSILTAGVAPAVKVYFDRKTAKAASIEQANQKAAKLKIQKKQENIGTLIAAIGIVSVLSYGIYQIASQVMSSEPQAMPPEMPNLQTSWVGNITSSLSSGISQLASKVVTHEQQVMPSRIPSLFKAPLVEKITSSVSRPFQVLKYCFDYISNNRLNNLCVYPS